MSLRAVMATTGSLRGREDSGSVCFQYVETVHGRHLYVCEQQIEMVLCCSIRNTLPAYGRKQSPKLFFGWICCLTSLGSVAFGYGRRQSAIYGEDVPEIQGAQENPPQEPDCSVWVVRGSVIRKELPFGVLSGFLTEGTLSA